MNNKKKVSLVPSLRFPEFRGAGKWRASRLGELAVSESSAFALNKLQIEDGGYPVHGADGIVGYINTFAQKGDYITIVKDGSGVGRLSLKSGKSSILSTLAYLKNKSESEINIYWLYYCICSLDLRKYVKGSGIPHIYFSDYSNEPVGLPVLREQQKIAACLSSLDELISAQALKVDALKTHKKGLMQQLFPREGETQPLLRFPEFDGAPGWTNENLEDLAKRGSGHTPGKSFPEYYGGGVKWVSLADSKRLDAGLISESETEISELGIKKSSAVLHPAGAVLISRDAGVGKSAVMAVPMAVSQHFIVWVCDGQKLSNWFLYYVLQLMKPIFERIATGSTIKTIGLPFFKGLAITVPTLSEQKRIADCLYSVDEFITAAAKELEALKTHKKGLMQQLFPSLEDAEA